MNDIEIKRKIKHCPLCGGKPELKHKGQKGRILRCSECRFGLMGAVKRFTTAWLEGYLIDKWNKRIES